MRPPISVDVALPDRDGIGPCRDLRSTDDKLVCVVLNSYTGAQARLAAAVVGAAAVVSKAAAVGDLADVIRGDSPRRPDQSLGITPHDRD